MVTQYGPSLDRRRTAKRPLVLVVDDGAEARDLYRTCLEFYGVEVETAEDGPTGIALALAMGPDIVVLDFSMPKMDGAEVLRRLKADDRTREIPVIMITAVPALVRPSAREACGAFLEKPCGPELLEQTIDELLGQSASGVPMPRPV
jgi:CheY-like chemotaxis protein